MGRRAPNTALRRCSWRPRPTANSQPMPGLTPWYTPSRARAAHGQTAAQLTPKAPPTSRTSGGVPEEGACPLLHVSDHEFGAAASKGLARVCESVFPRSPRPCPQARSDAPKAPPTSRTSGGVPEEGACPLLPISRVAVGVGRGVAALQVDLVAPLLRGQEELRVGVQAAALVRVQL